MMQLQRFFEELYAPFALARHNHGLSRIAQGEWQEPGGLFQLLRLGDRIGPDRDGLLPGLQAPGRGEKAIVRGHGLPIGIVRVPGEIERDGGEVEGSFRLPSRPREQGEQ